MSIYIGWPLEVSDMQWPAPSWFHVPLNSEWVWLKTIMDWLSLTTWDSWRINLHMPFAGNRSYSSASTGNQGSYGFYWSSSPYGNPSFAADARYLSLNSSNVSANSGDNRADGLSVRCFKNSYVTPDSSWTVVQWTLWSAWIFWNQSEWLISITSYWSTWYTIQDKNLWAIDVYNGWDTLSEANCGKYYQRWNNYWFPRTWSVTTSSTQVNASSYWPWNYYTGSTFITTRRDPRDSSYNDNLWWWESQWTSTKSVEVQNIYIGKKPYEWNDLCFTANTAWSTVTLNKYWSPTEVSLETSTDWTTWSSYTIWDTITLSNIWDKVYWRNTSTSTTGFSSNSASYEFAMSWSIAWSWDVTTLINKNWTDTLTWGYCFRSLFLDCTSLTVAPKLPATTLTNWCYQDMFRRCSSLTACPSLPATTLSDSCYYEMFSQCTSLETLPTLPATTLLRYSYAYMFNYCSKIKLSTTQTWEYQTSYRIPTTWTGSTWTNSLYNMFGNTWWTFTWTPTINTTYYTSNTVV